MSATTAVPLPTRAQTGSSQHRIALLIREGRKAAEKIAEEQEQLLLPSMEVLTTTTSTVLEKDFTVEGKKGVLACPFSAAAAQQPNQDGGGQGKPPLGSLSGAGRVDNSQDQAGNAATSHDDHDPTPHKSSDPICAAMIEDVAAVPAAAAASQCPIRYLDKHSPEEIARYVETHKHEIPRSHEVCVRRYQKNEEQIRKLDAKYGNLVSMVEDLSHLHRPMLPPAADKRGSSEVVDNASNKRVEDWAQTIVAGHSEQQGEGIDDEIQVQVGEGDEGEDERQGRFDRPFREVRVGESPSRPWGIPVPPPKPGFRPDDEAARSSPFPPMNPQIAVQGPNHIATAITTPGNTEAKKCPFDHTKMPGFMGMLRPESTQAAYQENPHERLSSPLKNEAAMPSSPPQATFVNLSDHIPPAAVAPGSGVEKRDERPQVVFNISGPVFIGYPMEQAMQFMQQFQQLQQQQGR